MKNSFLFLFVFILATSCATYTIPIGSFKQQFAGIDSAKLIKVTVAGPLNERYYYLANPITIIACEDKDGTAHLLANGPSIEARFTHGYRNQKTAFYFDRICVDSDVVSGGLSRFIPAIRKSIPLDSITKIEVQDGHKKYRYVDK